MLESTTEEFQREVCKGLDTSLEQLHKDVESLKEWLKTQTHLPQCSSDTMLTTYLITSKMRMEQAQRKIENYYTARAQITEIFGERDPLSEDVQDSAKEVRFFTLPKLTPDGCRVSIASFVTGDPKKYDIVAFSKRAMSMVDLQMNQEAFCKGHYFVFDDTYFSMSHVMKVTAKWVGQMMHCAQDVYPVNIKGIIFFNAPSYVEIIINLMRPFLKSKLFKRIHVHKEGAEVLENYFPKAMLPKDYGGDEATCDELNVAWMKCLEENREWFLGEGSLKADLKIKSSKKPTSGKNEEFQELHGSFKALSID